MQIESEITVCIFMHCTLLLLHTKKGGILYRVINMFTDKQNIFGSN